MDIYIYRRAFIDILFNIIEIECHFWDYGGTDLNIMIKSSIALCLSGLMSLKRFYIMNEGKGRG